MQKKNKSAAKSGARARARPEAASGRAKAILVSAQAFSSSKIQPNGLLRAQCNERRCKSTRASIEQKRSESGRSSKTHLLYLKRGLSAQLTSK